MYKEMSKDVFEHHDKWIIAFCPDTDSFFVTDQRCFYWDTEGKHEFDSEENGIKFFEENLYYFLIIDNTLMSEMCYGITYEQNKEVYLENTERKYKVNNERHY